MYAAKAPDSPIVGGFRDGTIYNSIFKFGSPGALPTAMLADIGRALS